MAFTEAGEVTAVSDASFLIGLCMIDHFHLLEHLVDRLYIPPAVWHEVVDQGENRPGTREVQNATLIQRQDVQNVLATQSLRLFLDPGEAESIVLAQEISCDLLFVDDLKARKAAKEAGIKTMGVAGFLLAAKLNGLLPEIHPLLQTLQRKGFRLSRSLVNSVLKEAGESVPE